MASATGLTQQDKIIYYASVFVYNPKLRATFKNYNPALDKYESNQRISERLYFRSADAAHRGLHQVQGVHEHER